MTDELPIIPDSEPPPAPAPPPILSPSPGTPGEGRGGGSALADLPDQAVPVAPNPHPIPPPEYRERERAAPPPATRRFPPWLVTLATNAPILVLLCLLLPAARFLEDEDKVDKYHARIVMLAGINITLAVGLQLINGISGQFSLGHAGFMAVGAYAAGFATKTFAERFERAPGVPLFFVSLAITVGLAALVAWLLYRAIRSTRRWWRGFPNLLFLMLMLWIVADLAISGDAAAPASLRRWTLWSRVFGALAELYSTTVTHGERPFNFLLALLGGGVCAALVGLLVGMPTLRLRGDYLAIATLGFTAIIQNVLALSAPLGGATGMQVTPYANTADPEARPPLDPHYIFPWIYGTAILATLIVWRLSHSAKGRAIKAVREDEIAAAAIGIDTTHYKVISFVIGAFLAGVAGALWVHNEGYVNPSAFGPFMLTKSIEVVVMVTLGGLGSIWGAIVAAIALTFLPEVLRSPEEWFVFFLKPVGVKALHLPLWLSDTNDKAPGLLQMIGNNRMVVYSALLVIAMLAKGRRYGSWPVRWRRRAGTSS